MIEVPNSVPVIIERVLWDRVRDMTAKRQHTGGRYNAVEEYALSGLVRCSCGASMTGCRTTPRETAYAYYRCSAQQSRRDKTCTVKRIRKDLLEDTVLLYIRENILSPDKVSELTDKANKHVIISEDKIEIKLKFTFNEKNTRTTSKRDSTGVWRLNGAGGANHYDSQLLGLYWTFMINRD